MKQSAEAAGALVLVACQRASLDNLPRATTLAMIFALEPIFEGAEEIEEFLCHASW